MAKCEFSKMSPEERAEHGRRGGIASGESKRRKKAMKESLDVLLSMPIRDGKPSDLDFIKNFASLKGKNITVEQAMLIAQIQKAMKGDTQAMTFLRDTSGQKPNDDFSVSLDVPVVLFGEGLIKE